MFYESFYLLVSAKIQFGLELRTYLKASLGHVQNLILPVKEWSISLVEDSLHKFKNEVLYSVRAHS